MKVILDHHAVPGVQTPGQMFTGLCVFRMHTITRTYVPFQVHE